MQFKKGYITLERLKEKDIELVRRWRNCSKISQFMEYREHITKEMQKAWFRSINNTSNLYLLIYYKGKKIGLANGKNFDWHARTVEGGIFIWDKQYQGTEVPVFVFLILSDLLINVFNLTSHGRILKGNKRAQRFNKLLGYELCEGQENIENQLYKLTPGTYARHAGVFRKAFLSIGQQHPLDIIFEKDELEKKYAVFFESQMNKEFLQPVEFRNGNKVFRYSI
ncbi:MAG: GNAT family N-acetyltransferase [Bacteroidales bacterium]|nr:GNAT family N-acetyltransferase [Bacteroidales bacterium]MCF8343001.1 GNAT family N-acetyltransferase [Bacteroidales bacterium]MCF8350323.1 GNAT family N-acetyltransferase [Bacteroidales bacterium]MCF8375973.1 GNAT family N-acetyltransferase [Bacteroidales bacterium]MCF8400461.1 GNAT family N-acetyltransferase [Bacteroidales bacterium]